MEPPPHDPDRLARAIALARGTCRGCRATILWAVTEAGNRQPVNAEPDPTGNLILWADTAGQLRSRVDQGLLEAAVPHDWHMPHHATCPAVEQFR